MSGDGPLYVDSSAVVRAYFPDERGHREARDLIFAGTSLVLTSALTEVELTSAVRAAARAGRLDEPDDLLESVRADMSDGHLNLIVLDDGRLVDRARRLCDRHRLRALDAIHLAVALGEVSSLDPDGSLIFATCDADQAAAARDEGLRVEMPAS